MELRELRLAMSQRFVSPILTLKTTSSNVISEPFENKPYGGFTPLFVCDKLGNFPSRFCCGSNRGNCCTVATFDYGSTGTSFKTGMDQMILELAALNSSSAASVAPMTVTVTATLSATGISAASASQSSTAVSSTSNLGTTIGLAIGIPVGILALGLLGFLFYRQRSINRNIVIQAAVSEVKSSVYRQPSTTSYRSSKSEYSSSKGFSEMPRHEVPG
ncbi:hypothetical protein GLAREA_05354 [Glarea lozoyensis ATCC 20868]|uniref:Mid2 domain-containing protein n=1 Tax=Glarea lozoyensis (strain ATCC 20868 / MF5171) TaxID=1116229 RepID=S3DVN3_GLAL2|nr:uncharacterized protein GLAREA_05354 [Glarea lozoyensis ATCC 20868]EPE36016.1 hypothetical protein GLAREA_05354 [Glarea lozoyensis ATCC 20868]